MGGRFDQIAERYLEPVIRGSSEYMCACPFCGGAATLQFNVDNGLWLCFKCDAKGSSKTLVKKMGGVYADPIVSVEAIREHMDRLRMMRKRAEKMDRVFDESTLRRYRMPDDYWSDARGFSDEAIKTFDLGYDPIKDRNTIAFRNPKGELLGVIERLKDPDLNIRYIYPDGFNRKNSLFGSWLIEDRKCAMVEGSTDVIAMFDANRPALAQYGSSISDGQIRLLHRLGIKELVMFYDYDEAGRKAEERSREAIKGIILRTPVWDRERYCWHKKLCGCGEHTWRTIAKCDKKRLCKCGRKHEMDPGSLSIKERKKMYDDAVLVGSKKKWPTRKFA